MPKISVCDKMRGVKSERLKKLEAELRDLEQWLDLGLVPKKDLEKHKEEIESLRGKVEEEKQRIRDAKESGELEEYVMPKKSQPARQAYQESTMPGVDAEGDTGLTETGFETNAETYETESGTTTVADDDGSTQVDDDEEDPFSDKNRWKRGILDDPDSDNW